MAKAAARNSIIQLPRFELLHIVVRLVGNSPLICHAWSHKAKSEMLSKQMKRAASAKAAKDPEQDFQDSLYPYPGGGYAFPTIAFKAAAVDACSHVDGITKVEARGAFHIDGDWIKILGEPEPREDMVRIGMGTADIRFRGQFKLPWYAEIPVRFNAGVLSEEQITHLFDIAGFSIGVGEWRPQRDGSFGMFRVAKGEEWERAFKTDAAPSIRSDKTLLDRRSGSRGKLPVAA